MKYKIFIKNENGIIKEAPYNTGLWNNRYIKYHNQDVIVEITKYSKSRTLEQNKKYWMYLKIISEFTGYTKEELHFILASEFIPYEVKYKEQTIIMPKSTTSLTVQEFMIYLEQIRLWAFQEFEIILENEL